MIRIQTEGRDGKRICALIISEENVKRLKAGYPIRAEFQIAAGLTFILDYAETEQAGYEKLKAAGLIGPDTVFEDRGAGIKR